MTLMFSGTSGRRPSSEAHRYIYKVLASSLQADLNDAEGWVFGGVTQEPDRRRARKAAEVVIKELIRKGSRP